MVVSSFFLQRYSFLLIKLAIIVNVVVNNVNVGFSQVIMFDVLFMSLMNVCILSKRWKTCHFPVNGSLTTL